jgi:aldose 1-epimerase
MGSIVGRYANRIANGKFKINETEYQLACNNAPNHLHGGDKGFDKMIWDATIVDGAVPKLLLFYLSKDGEEGYPGNLSVTVEYSYTEDDELIIEYFADTDKATHVNLTSHSYFNLTGDVSKNILGHSLQINADYYTAVNEHKIPTGKLVAVDGTPFDFKAPKKISQHIDEADMGYDHNYVLKKDGTELATAAILSDPEQELELTVFTTEPAMQLYTAHFLDGSLINRDGKKIGKSAGVCLETQHYPDAPNHPEFPSTLLLPQETFTSKTIYKISLK